MLNVTSCTLEESDEDVEWRADVLRRSPGQQEVLSAEQPGRAGLRRVVQAARQPVELRQVNVREPDQRPVAWRQVVSDAPVESRFQRVLKSDTQIIITTIVIMIYFI